MNKFDPMLAGKLTLMGWYKETDKDYEEYGKGIDEDPEHDYWICYDNVSQFYKCYVPSTIHDNPVLETKNPRRVLEWAMNQ